MSSLKSVVGVRFSISKKIFLVAGGYADLQAERYVGCFQRRYASGNRYSITWESDSLSDVYALNRG